MRVVLLSLALLSGLAAHAQAQPLNPLSFQERMDLQLRESQLRAQQDLANRQSLALQNQLDVLESQVRTERAIADVRAQAMTPSVLPPPAGGPPRTIDAGQLASIPDDRLAASNARVREAAENRR